MLKKIATRKNHLNYLYKKNMEINITLIERYFEKIKYPVTVLSTTDNFSSLIFQAGEPEMNGSKRIILQSKELLEILTHNKIIGEGSSVKAVLNDENDREKDSKIEKLIYETLVDYIYQMLNASRGKIYNKQLQGLPKHQSMYFKEN